MKQTLILFAFFFFFCFGFVFHVRLLCHWLHAGVSRGPRPNGPSLSCIFSTGRKYRLYIFLYIYARISIYIFLYRALNIYYLRPSPVFFFSKMFSPRDSNKLSRTAIVTEGKIKLLSNSAVFRPLRYMFPALKILLFFFSAPPSSPTKRISHLKLIFISFFFLSFRHTHTSFSAFVFLWMNWMNESDLALN